MASVMTENLRHSPLAVLNDQHSGLKLQDALNILLQNEDNAISSMPMRPKGGQVFVFKPKSQHNNDDWKSDGHTWTCEGVRKMKYADFTITKRHYKLFLGYDGKKRKIEGGFMKHVYHFEDDEIALIHYIGDDSLSKQRSHGNAKKTNTVFVRAQPSLLEFLNRKVSRSTENPHKIYKDIIGRGRFADVSNSRAPLPPMPVPPPPNFPEASDAPDEVSDTLDEHPDEAADAPDEAPGEISDAPDEAPGEVSDAPDEPPDEGTDAPDEAPDDAPGEASSVQPHPALSLPRNVHQIKNVKKKVEKAGKLGHDEIFNLHQLAYEEDGFVHHITTFPDLVCVVGSPYMLDEIKRLLKSKQDMIFSYDTTFSVGQCYVSPLLFKHPDFDNEPVMPILFLLHERKLASHHACLFSQLVRSCGKLKNVPILIDMELGIRKAIEEQTGMKIVGCWRHLRKDIEAWVTKHGGGSNDRKVYVDGVYELMRLDSEATYLDKLDEKKQTWSQAFVDYFQKELSKRVKYYASWNISQVVELTSSGITTNMSEGFNWLIKDLTGWKEKPIDSIVMCFRLLQNFYEQEIHRGQAGIGTYILKSKEPISIGDLTVRPTIPVQEIVKSIKEKSYQVRSKDSRNVHPGTRIFKAKELLYHDCVSHVPKQGCFVVRSGKNLYNVEIFPKQKCSCQATSDCAHILAVLLGLNYPESDLKPQKTSINLTVLRKNARGKHKPGRKRPRVGDVDIEPPSDSEIAQKRKKNCPISPESTLSISPESTPRPANTPQHEVSSTSLLGDEQVDTYAETVWLPSNHIYHVDLKKKDKAIIEGTMENGWLDDIIIDAAMCHVGYQFNHIKGLQSCVLASCNKFRKQGPEDGPVLQIVNTDLDGKGSHWILLSTFNCPPATVDVFDSCNSCYLNDRVQAAIASLIRTDGSILTLRFQYSDLQHNACDCGLYAIANMVTVANGINPSEVMYDEGEMRACLIRSLENQVIEVFPHVPFNSQHGELAKLHIELFCSCKMPDNNLLYFECETCEHWYHPHCEGLGSMTKEYVEKSLLHCKGCQAKGFKRFRRPPHRFRSSPNNATPNKNKNKKKKKGKW